MPVLPPDHLRLRARLRAKLARLATVSTPPRLWWATVTAVAGDGTVTVQQGTLTAVPGIACPTSYSPTVGDRVMGLAVDGDYVVINAY